MAIAFVQSAPVVTGSTTAVTAGITTTSGNAIIALSVNGSASATNACTVTDSKNNVWIRLFSAANSAGGGDLEVWYCNNILGGASHTFTTTVAAASTAHIGVFEFSGFNRLNPSDRVGAGNSATNTAVDTGVVINTAPSGILIAAVVCANTGTSVTVGSGWSGLITGNSNGFSGMEYKIVSTPASNSGAAAFTLGGSVLYQGVQLSFRAQQSYPFGNNLRPHPFSPGLAR